MYMVSIMQSRDIYWTVITGTLQKFDLYTAGRREGSEATGQNDLGLTYFFTLPKLYSF